MKLVHYPHEAHARCHRLGGVQLQPQGTCHRIQQLNKGDEPIEKQLGSQAHENASHKCHKSILGTPVSAERNQPKDNLSEAQLAGSKKNNK